MNIKRFIIQFCLLLACMLLQAHIILPHLHHDGIVCITKDGSTVSTDCHSGDEPKHTENHCSDTIDECDIRQIVLRQNDVDEDSNTNGSIHLSSLYSIITPLCYSLIGYPYSISCKAETPYIDTYTFTFTGSIKSLRAPPYLFG